MVDTVRSDVTDAVEAKGPTIVQKWIGQFAAYDREFSTWEARSTRIIKRYRDEIREKSQDNAAAKFNILWANVQTLIPAVYSKIPKPDVSRRFRDNDQVGRVASLILERALEFESEHYPDFRNAMQAAVRDRFLGGRGTTWVRYEPHIRALEQKQPTDGVQVTEDVDEPQEELDYECAPVDYVHWKDFGHTVARTWDEVTAVWRKVYMTRQACIERFGEEVGSKIPLDCVPEDLKRGEMGGGDDSDATRACVYECWDKQTLKVYWICKSLPDPLDEKDDPLELEGFFPCPRPLYSTMTSESLIPVPDFALYQDQAKELDTLADRIQGLIEMLQVKGAYDASLPTLARLFTEGQNGTLIPVTNWQAFSEKNGLSGAVDIVDLKPIYEALKVAYDSVQQVLSQVYDLTGISDIIRGQSNANETATAQKIKGQYASLRLKSMQGEVAVFASALLQQKAQIICGNFAPETILKMSGATELSEADQALIPQAMALLIGPERMQDPIEGGRGKNPMRTFRIEVNADTMVQLDEDTIKEQSMEFIAAQGAFIEKALPVVQASPALAPLIASMWKFSVRAFKIGKTLEGEFDVAIEKAKQLAENPPQKSDPEMERVKADSQIQQARVQADKQANQMKMQAAQQEMQAKMQADAQLERMRMQSENERHMRELQSNAAESQRTAQMQQDTELKKTALQIAGQIEIAKINAKVKEKADAQAAQIAGAEQEHEAQEREAESSAAADTQSMMKQLLETQAELLQTIAAPKQVMRDDQGRVIGMQVIK